MGLGHEAGLFGHGALRRGGLLLRLRLGFLDERKVALLRRRLDTRRCPDRRLDLLLLRALAAPGRAHGTLFDLEALILHGNAGVFGGLLHLARALAGLGHESGLFGQCALRRGGLLFGLRLGFLGERKVALLRRRLDTRICADRRFDLQLLRALAALLGRRHAGEDLALLAGQRLAGLHLNLRHLAGLRARLLRPLAGLLHGALRRGGLLGGLRLRPLGEGDLPAVRELLDLHPRPRRLKDLLAAHLLAALARLEQLDHAGERVADRRVLLVRERLREALLETDLRGGR